MNTDDPKNDPSQLQPNTSDQATGNDLSLVDLVDALQSVDPKLSRSAIERNK